MALDVFYSVTLLFGMSINLYSTCKFDIHSSCVITLTLNRNVYHSLVCIKSSSESELVVWWTGTKEITKLVSAKIMAFSQNLHLVCWTHWQIQSVWRTDFKKTRRRRGSFPFEDSWLWMSVFMWNSLRKQCQFINAWMCLHYVFVCVWCDQACCKRDKTSMTTCTSSTKQSLTSPLGCRGLFWIWTIQRLECCVISVSVMGLREN